MNTIFKYLKGDKNIWVITLLLGILSIVSVFSFIPILVKVKGLSYSFLFFKHFILLALGFVIMFVIHKLPFRVFSKLSKLIFYVAIILLVLTMFVGESVNGADRWLKIPLVPFSFQTSDFAKLALVLYLSKQLVKRRNEFGDLKIVGRHILLPIALTVFLILPSNLSTALIIGMIAFVLMIFAQFPWKWIGLSVGTGVMVFLMLLQIAKYYPQALPRVNTWNNRIENMFTAEENPQEQMQINNSLLAIKNGSFIGKGPGNGELKRYIPEAYADFYFAALVEEGGLVLALVLISLYLMLFYRMIRIALKIQEKNEYAALVVIGIGLIIMFSAIVNMLVCTKLIPVTGQNMPLLSMGGTSAWFTAIALGIVLSASRELETKSSESIVGSSSLQNAVS
ncbi:cell division protein FtsW [Putridiphycobacter roseus]|uniref:Probable peptidoglycan glycosyltransferase FtsW n=1 Tax=Putridiphycobacter roseus TaxID=2219161 RepID=A0A2W1N2N5_9FLAO|nr:FtsW/RodA/SpoVE family cell cycle protein [Putridiphycobacter roseus]PZE18567.1 cell division protein FtsW [Putridiphycobacter roseus]